MNRFRFIKVRDVKTPSRGNAGDAGLDFYIPRNLDPQQLIHMEANQSPNHFTPDFVLGVDTLTNFVTQIDLYPGGRILIPSGIKPLIEPQESMLMAANKSGLASKKGILYTAEIVDSPYVGEIHIGIINLSRVIQLSLFMFQFTLRNQKRFNQRNSILNLKCGEQEVKVDLIQQEINNGYKEY
mgnify:CR=1 FL=1